MHENSSVKVFQKNSTGSQLFSCTSAAPCWTNKDICLFICMPMTAVTFCSPLPDPLPGGLNIVFPSFCLQCTPSCGPGYRHRVVLCKSGESGDTLPDSKCPKHGRPTSRVRCNLQRCPPPLWVTGPWGEVRWYTPQTCIGQFSASSRCVCVPTQLIQTIQPPPQFIRRLQRPVSHLIKVGLNQEKLG